MRRHLKSLLKGKSHSTSREDVNFQSPASSVNQSSKDGSSTTPPPVIMKGDNFGLQTLYEPDRPEDAKVDIIFVHGLTGNSFNTWLHKERYIHWPSQLLKDDIQLARILIFGYDANVASFWGGSSQNRLANHAENLVGQLVGLREDTESEGRQTIFIAHSLGGLVVERALQVSVDSAERHIRTVEQNTLGIAFLGTPHSGSDWAPFAKAIGNLLSLVGKRVNVNILDTLKRDSQTLLDVENWFGHWLRRRAESGSPVNITTFFEELELPLGGKVVEESQAKMTGYSSYGIHANHMEMTKFSGLHDPGYMAVRREIRRWCKGINVQQAGELKNEALTQQVEELLIELQRHTCAYKERKDVNPLRIPGTCEWFTRHQKFQHWNGDDSNGLLWVSADPGCGKSVLARYLVEEVIPQPGRAVCYFFFKDGYPDQQSASKALCAILHQLFLQQPKLAQESILKQFKLSRDTIYESISQLWSLLVEAVSISQIGEITCVLDALDECQGEDFKVLSQLITAHYLRSEKSRLKFILLSRPYQHIQWQFQELEDDMPMIHLSGEEEEEMEDIIKEIDLVIQSRVSSIGRRRKLLPEECEHLHSLLTAVPNRTYLWVTLTLDVIENLPGFTKGNVKRAVTQLPQTVDEAYSKILSRSLDVQKAFKALHCVIAAEWPLMVDDLMCMITIEEDKTFEEILDDLEPETRFRITLRNLCGLCLVVIDNKVYFLHQTVREFLVSPRSRISMDLQNASIAPDKTVWKHSIEITESHMTLTKISLWTIMSLPIRPDGFLELPNPSEETFDGIWTYSRKHWHLHYRLSADQHDATIQTKVLHLLRPKPLLWRLEMFTVPFSVTHSPRSRSKLGAIYSHNHTAESNMLLIASIYGFDDVVKTLLGTENVDVNIQDVYHGMTPLSWAICSNSRTIFKVLLAHKDVDMNICDNKGLTPLYHAAYELRVEMLSDLLLFVSMEAQAGVVPPILAMLGRSKTSTEAKEIFQMLLAHDSLNINASLNKYGETALMIYVGDAHRVEQIVQHPNIQINAQDSKGKTALMEAASWEGYTDIVEILLRHPNIKPNICDKKGKTALMKAASWGGNTDTVEILLRHPNIKPNICDKKGKTALMYAARGRSSETVKLLIQHPDIDFNARDNAGQTALNIAKAAGREENIHIILQHRAHDLIFRNEELDDILHYLAIRPWADLLRTIIKETSPTPSTINHLLQTTMRFRVNTTVWIEKMRSTTNHLSLLFGHIEGSNGDIFVSIKECQKTLDQSLSSIMELEKYLYSIEAVEHFLSELVPAASHLPMSTATVTQKEQDEYFAQLLQDNSPCFVRAYYSDQDVNRILNGR
ncbi:hypothetical protein DM02DRAFT_598696 [Periconia macrospinosa]|uniref:Uncharacterized protein n=1 Tax=Periconia macrospinosa TaxID=97972 RepID=A0A2V1DFA0_9PLEO|nr:hypothetical protein DM02DRAFT_598696 [Periconia macrospinosa]